MTSMIRTIAVLAACMVAPPAVAADLIADGSFETQGVYAGAGFCYFQSTCSTSGAWTSNGSAGFINESSPDWPGIQTDGSYHAFIQGGGFIGTQYGVVAPDAGLYRLTWTEAGRTLSGYDAPHGYSVLVSRLTVADTIFSGASSPTGNFIARQSNSFTASQGEGFYITFVGDGSGGDRTTFLDQVSLQYVGPAPGVPEPAAWALTVGGFGLMGGAVRHRRREKALTT